jgi:hypothetical protein
VIRKLILSAAVAAAALAALTATPSTAAATVPAILPHHKFDVLVEHNGVWERHGTYRLHAEAELIAVRLRHRGLHVEIRQY